MRYRTDAFAVKVMLQYSTEYAKAQSIIHAVQEAST
jgi:hypothetical protein